MIHVKKSVKYYINERALTFSENDLNDPQRVAVSIVSGTVIMVREPGIIDYASDGNFERWTLKGYSTKLVNNALHYVYARLSRADRTALIVFSVKDYNIDGSITTVTGKDENGNDITETTDPSTDYFYIKIGELTATDSKSERELTYDSGLLGTEQGNEESNTVNEMWELDKYSTPWLVRAKQWLSSFTVKGFITLIGGLVFRSGDTEKAVTDIKRSTDSDEEVPVGDNSLATSKYVESELEKLDDRFLSKIHPDETEFHIGLKGGITTTEAVSTDYAKDTVKAGWAIKKNEEEEWYAEADHIIARILANVYDLLVKNNAVFKGNLSSEEFVSGFVGGKGWAIRVKEWLNAAGVAEQRSVAEFDDLIVRGTMRVYEFVVSQLLGENDNRIFTGMMEVDHYDAAEGKVYLSTNGGKLYNPFRTEDIIIVQQYGGMPSEGNGHYVTKQYELVITEAGVGNIADGEDRLDWVTFRSFTTSMEGGDESLIVRGDTFVRIDNLSDPARKGTVQIMSVGEDTPYMDMVYGAKTDPENALKGRLGNIGGVYNPLFGWLKEFGAYLINLYAVGEFRIAHTGEDVADAIEMAKGSFRTNYRQTTYDFGEESNFLANASFINDCEGWVLEEGVSEFFLVDGLPQYFNYELLATETTYAGLASFNDRDMLRLLCASVKQENGMIRKPGTHKEYSGEDGVKEVVDKLYLNVRFYCHVDGELEVGFTDGEGEFIDGPFHSKDSYVSNIDAYTISLEGTWDGVGDFVIRSTGDMYIDMLTLTDRPLDNYRIETSTRIEQDATKIALLGQRISGAENSITNLGVEIDAAEERITAYVDKEIEGVEASVSQLQIDVDGISTRVSAAQGAADNAKKAADAAQKAADDAAADALAAQNTADSASSQATANATAIQQNSQSISAVAAAFQKDANGNLVLTSAAGTVITSEMAETYATKTSVDSLGNRVTTAEGNITTMGGQISLKADQTTVDSLGNRITDAESSIQVNADNISSKVSKDGVISAINQSAESVSIDANRININGVFSANNSFKIDTDGTTYIGGFKVSGNDITNEGFNNDATVIFRNDNDKTFAAIGGNVLPTSAGFKCIARFENEKEGSVDNYAVIVSAKNATIGNVAIAMNGGCVSGLAYKTEIIGLESVTSATQPTERYVQLERGVNALYTTPTFQWRESSTGSYQKKTRTTYITLPTMYPYDDGYTIKIKRGTGSGTVKYKPSVTYRYGENGILSVGMSTILYSQESYATDYDDLGINEGDAMELVYFSNLSIEINGSVYYGLWVQYRNGRS